MMRAMISVLSLLLVGGVHLFVYAAGPCSHDANTFRCVHVVGNYDGDTIRVDIPGEKWIIGKNVGVRVRGIDTPEMHGAGRCEREAAAVARERVSTLLRDARRVNLENVARDKYFRILADVTVDGRSIGETLINEGLAVVYDGGTKQALSWCKKDKS